MSSRQHGTENSSAQHGVTFGPFRLTTDSLQLWQGQKLIPLQPRPLAVLQYFVEHPLILISNDTLRQAVWGRTMVSATTVQVCVREVRKALGEKGTTPQYIETVGREGYRFIGHVVTEQLSRINEEEENQKAKIKNQKAKIGTGTGELEARPSLFPSPDPRSQSPEPVVVGREADLTQLHTLFAKAQQGERQIVFITGEAGIGKTTLVDAFLHRLTGYGQSPEEPRAKSQEHGAKQGAFRFALSTQLSALCSARGQCIEHYGEGEPYLPLLEALGQLCQGPQGAAVIAVLRRYAPTWLLHLPGLIEPEEREALQQRGTGTSQGQMLREITEALEALSQEHPVIIVLEDLHVSDPSTVELITYLAQRRSSARLFLVGTYRPVEVVLTEHPLRPRAHELVARGYAHQLVLELFTEAEVATYLQQRLESSALPVTLASQLYHRTDGNALFVTSTVGYLLTHQRLVQNEGQWHVTGDLSSDDIPQTLQHLLLAQLDNLAAEHRQVLEIASVVGATFALTSIAAGLQMEEATIEDICAQLARGPFIEERGIARWSDGTISEQYGFRHGLYQDVLYQRLSASRRARLHLAIGTREEIGYGAQAKEHAAELARHFTEGRDISRALQYTVHAGRTALARGAHVEAERIFTHGLTLLTAQLDNDERQQHELWLQMGLSVALMASKGVAAPEVEHALQRAHTLCRQLGDRPELFPVVLGLWAFALIRGELSITRSLAEQTLRMADEMAEQSSLALAHTVMLTTLYFQGALAAARVHGEYALSIVNTIRTPPQEFNAGFDPEERTRNNLALVLLVLGYVDQAIQLTRTALAHADILGHLQTRAAALQFLAGVHSGRREWAEMQTRSTELVTFATMHNLPYWWAQGTMNHGIALTQQGEIDEGIAQIQQGLTVYRMTGAGLGITRILGWLAEAQGLAGQFAEGLATLDEALQIAERNDERIWEAELYRRKGELLLAQGNTKQHSERLKPKAQSTEPVAAAEAYFLKAISIAQQQQAKVWELRAVMNLVRLRQQQVKDHGLRITDYASRARLEEARQLLAEVYNWFTEGLNTQDLQEAKVMLEAIRD